MASKRVVLFIALLAGYGVFLEGRFGSIGAPRMDALGPRAREVERAIAEKRFERALPLALELSESYPREPLIQLWLAAIYRGTLRPMDEVDVWERFIRLGSEPGEACPWLAEAQARIGGPDIPAYERCARLDPDEPERLVDLASALERSGRAEDALNAYRRASELDPTHPVVARGLERLSRSVELK